MDSRRTPKRRISFSEGVTVSPISTDMESMTREQLERAFAEKVQTTGLKGAMDWAVALQGLCKGKAKGCSRQLKGKGPDLDVRGQLQRARHLSSMDVKEEVSEDERDEPFGVYSLQRGDGLGGRKTAGKPEALQKACDEPEKPVGVKKEPTEVAEPKDIMPMKKNKKNETEDVRQKDIAVPKDTEKKKKTAETEEQEPSEEEKPMKKKKKRNETEDARPGDIAVPRDIEKKKKTEATEEQEPEELEKPMKKKKKNETEDARPKDIAMPKDTEKKKKKTEETEEQEPPEEEKPMKKKKNQTEDASSTDIAVPRDIEKKKKKKTEATEEQEASDQEKPMKKKKKNDTEDARPTDIVVPRDIEKKKKKTRETEEQEAFEQEKPVKKKNKETEDARPKDIEKKKKQKTIETEEASEQEKPMKKKKKETDDAVPKDTEKQKKKQETEEQAEDAAREDGEETAVKKNKKKPETEEKSPDQAKTPVTPRMRNAPQMDEMETQPFKHRREEVEDSDEEWEGCPFDIDLEDYDDWLGFLQCERKAMPSLDISAEEHQMLQAFLQGKNPSRAVRGAKLQHDDSLRSNQDPAQRTLDDLENFNWWPKGTRYPDLNQVTKTMVRKWNTQTRLEDLKNFAWWPKASKPQDDKHSVASAVKADLFGP